MLNIPEGEMVYIVFVYLDYTSQQGFIFQEGMHGVLKIS